MLNLIIWTLALSAVPTSHFWARRHIGRPVWASLDSTTSKESILFFTDLGYYGALSKLNGNILHRSQLKFPHVLSANSHHVLQKTPKRLQLLDLLSGQMSPVGLPEMEPVGFFQEDGKLTFFSKNARFTKQGIQTFQDRTLLKVTSERLYFSSNGLICSTNLTAPFSLCQAADLPLLQADRSWIHGQFALKLLSNNTLTWSSKYGAIWERNQDLAYIKHTTMIPVFSQQHRQLSRYEQLAIQSIRKQGKQTFQESIQLVIARVQCGLHESLSWFQQKFQKFKKLIQGSIKPTQIFSSPERDRHNGLVKNILAISQSSQAYLIDTVFGQIVFSGKMEHPQIQYLFESGDEAYAVWKDPKQGQWGVSLWEDIKFTILKRFKFNCSGQFKAALFSHRIAVIFGNQQCSFNLTSRQCQNQKLFTLRVNQNFLEGWETHGHKLQKSWKMKLPQGSVLEDLQSLKKITKIKRTLYSNVGVFFKHLQNYQVCVLAKQPVQNKIFLYIINGKTGQILFSAQQKFVETNLPISVQITQNTVVVSFFNMNNQVYQLWVLDSYFSEFETSAWKMLEKHYFQSAQTHNTTSSLVFKQQIFSLTIGVKNIYFTTSKDGLLSKNLLIVTPDNIVYMLHNKLLSPRRPDPAHPEDLIYENIQLPPYKYAISVLQLKRESYNLRLGQIGVIDSFSTRFESTNHFLFRGSDIFYTRLAVDGTFDRLTEDFNYLLVIVSMIAAVVGLIYVSRKNQIASSEAKYA